MGTKLRIRVRKSTIMSFDTVCKDHQNCAIAKEIRDIFPFADINRVRIAPFYHDKTKTDCQRIMTEIPLPKNAVDFIENFDDCPIVFRDKLEPIEFEITIPDEVIEQINIEELRPLLQNHPTLELVNA